MRKTKARATKTKRCIIIITMIATSLFVISVGCGNDYNNERGRISATDYVHLQEFVSFDELSSELPNINNTVLVNDMLYFTAMDEEYNGSRFHINRLFSLNVESMELTELSNYTQAHPTPSDADGGGAWISALSADSDGHLWIVEQGDFFRFDLPDNFDINNANEDELWAYRTDFEIITSLRKLNNTGAELLSIDLSQVNNRQAVRGINALGVDSEGNIYLGFMNSIFVIDIDGNILFDVAVETPHNRLIRLSDGTVAAFGDDGRGGMHLHVIDVQSRSLMSNVEIPTGTQNVFLGNDDFLIFASDGTYLLGIETETGNTVHLLNFVDNGVIPLNIRNIAILPDERILLVTQSINNQETDLVFLSAISVEEVGERQILTLGSWFTSLDVLSAVTRFNATSATHIIEIMDYGEWGIEHHGNSMMGMNRLIMDITTGNSPDIIDLTAGMFTPLFGDENRYMFSQWIERGAFVDLFPLIDADPALSRDDFVQGVLRTNERSGGLYMVSPHFWISTIISCTEIVGDGMWTIDDFKAVISDNPQADFPIGRTNNTRHTFLRIALRLGIDDYVDWESGTTYFDSDDFITLLEFAYNYFPNEVDFDNSSFDEWRAIIDDEPNYILEGRQLISVVDFANYIDFQLYRAVYGENLIFKGFPSASGGGSVLVDRPFAISSGTDNIQAAWEFVRMFLTPEWQRREVFGSRFPTNMEIFEERLSAYMESTNRNASWGNFHLEELDPLTQVDVEILMMLLDSMEHFHDQYFMLANIIAESADDYFNGLTSAEDAARIIQSRALRYVSERQG